MDPYAAALGVAEAPPPSDNRARAQAQVGAGESDRLRILQSELAGETDPKARAALQREIGRLPAQARAIGAQPGVASPQAAPASAADPYAAALGIGPGAAPAPVAAPAAPRTGAAAIPTAEEMSGQPYAPPQPAAAPAKSWRDDPWGAFKSAAQAPYDALQVAHNTVAGAVGGGVGAVVGAAEAGARNLVDVAQGRKPSVDLEANMTKRARDFTPQLPEALQTERGKEMTGAVGDALATHGPSIIAIGPELALLGRAMKTPPRGMASMEETFQARKGAAPAAQAPTGSPAAAPGKPAGPAAPAAAPASIETIPLKFEAAPEAPQAGQQFSTPERMRRLEVLRSVGLDNARASAVTGDAKAAAMEHQLSKVNNGAGDVFRAQLDAEKAALGNHAEGLVRATGGTQGIDQSAVYARGNSIVAPLDSLKDYFDRRTSALYKAADERAQGVPTELDNFRKTLGDDSQMTNADRVHLRAAVNSYAKQLGLVGEDGGVFSNAQQAETMRKFLGENWSPSNGKFVAKLKDALDKDVMSAAGEDVYAEARGLWKERADTLDNPNGIAKILDASGPEGINRAVPIEKIPDALAGMPVSQFTHVVETLKNSPAEIQPQAMQALNEVKAHFANKVQAIGTSQAGQWNAKGVTQFLNNNSSRMAVVFTPEEMAAFKNLNDAGHILAKDQSYPGAAIQHHNLLKSGMAAGLQSGAAAVGGALFGAPGAAAGSFLGSKAAGAMGEAASVRSAKRRLIPLNEIGKP